MTASVEVDQLIVNEYDPGQGINRHVDKIDQFADYSSKFKRQGCRFWGGGRPYLPTFFLAELRTPDLPTFFFRRTPLSKNYVLPPLAPGKNLLFWRKALKKFWDCFGAICRTIIGKSSV